MPTFWSVATQKLYEAFSGPRTRDTEFEHKLEEVKQLEKSILAICEIYHDFYKNTKGNITEVTVYRNQNSL